MWNKNKLATWWKGLELIMRQFRAWLSNQWRIQGGAMVLAEVPSERARPYLATMGSKKNKKIWSVCWFKSCANG